MINTPTYHRAAVICAAILFWLVLLKNAWIYEDFWIIARQAEQWFAGNGLRWNPHERAQLFTSTLGFFSLAFARLFTEDYFWIVAIRAVVFNALVLVLLRYVLPSVLHWAGAVLLLTASNIFMDYSWYGLGNNIGHVLLLSFLLFWQHWDSNPRNRKALYGLFAIAGLAPLFRHDFALILWSPMLYVFWHIYKHHSRRYLLVLLALMFVPIGLWTLFATYYFGFPLPLSAYFKLGGGLSRWVSLENGWNYYAFAFRHDFFAMLLIFMSLLWLFFRGRASDKVLAAGVSLHLFYVFYSGSDYVGGRFFTYGYLFSVVILVSRWQEIAKYGLELLDHLQHLNKRQGLYGLFVLSLLTGVVWLLDSINGLLLLTLLCYVGFATNKFMPLSRKQLLLMVVFVVSPFLVWNAFWALYLLAGGDFDSELAGSINAKFFYGQDILLSILSYNPVLVLFFVGWLGFACFSSFIPAHALLLGLLINGLFAAYSSPNLLASPILALLFLFVLWLVVGRHRPLSLSALSRPVVIGSMAIAWMFISHHTPLKSPLDYYKFEEPNGISNSRALFYKSSSIFAYLAYRRGEVEMYPNHASVQLARQHISKVQTPVLRLCSLGMQAFFSQRLDLKILDIYGYSDPLQARLPAHTTRPGHLLRKIPAGYIESVAHNRAELVDVDLNEYYKRLRRVTQEPLEFSQSRWRDILYVNLNRPPAASLASAPDKKPRYVTPLDTKHILFCSVFGNARGLQKITKLFAAQPHLYSDAKMLNHGTALFFDSD